jgi:hypothetical protein
VAQSEVWKHVGILLDFDYQPIISWIRGYLLLPLMGAFLLLGLPTGEHLGAIAERTPPKPRLIMRDGVSWTTA